MGASGAGPVRRGAALAGVVLVLGVLGGCTAAPTPPPSSPRSSAPPSATPTATPTPDPVLVPGGTAQANLPFFDFVNAKVVAANPDAGGKDFIDALVAAGFPKADMQVTVDTTTVNLKANSIQFSVKMGNSCLIGQYGPDSGGYHGEAVPALATGKCLVGKTRPIDW